MSEAGSPPPNASRPAKAPVGWAYVVSGTLALGALLRYLNPYTGIAARRWPWQLPSPLGWTRDVATVVFFGAMVIVPVVAAFLPARRARGIVVGAVAGLALSALADLAEFLYGVETYVPPVLAAVVAGALYAARVPAAARAGRAAAAVAGAVLLALLFYPLGTNEPLDPRKPSRDLEYRAVLPRLVGEITTRAKRTEDEQRTASESGTEESSAGALEIAMHPWSVDVFLATVTAVLGLAFALYPRRWIAWGATASFLLATAYPPVWFALADYARRPPHAAQSDVLVSALLAAGHSLRMQYAPFVLALFAATADMTRPGLEPPKP